MKDLMTSSATAPTRRRTSRSDAAARLLAAASSLMIERGSTEISLGDISERSGVNSALVKYHFGNKTGLLVALLERDAQSAMEQLNALLRADLSPTAKLKLHIAGVVNAYYRTPYLNRLIHDLLHQSSDEVARQVADFFVGPVVEFERQLLAEGIRRGEFRDVDPMIFYFTLFGAIDHMFYARHTLLYGFGVSEVTEDMRRKLIDLVTEMVLGAIKPG
jgi:AcrR family transcriptional regulator